jgi:hypothetical protein
LCKHPTRDVVLGETQEHVTDHNTKRWQFCRRCGAYRYFHAFQGKILSTRRVPWQLSDLMIEALKEK